ncbi:hypothetical protein LZ023_35260 (plasmid) [Pseudomonas silvicola]|nr:hypothetical protein LZ023_35260 [Pseudomonas silvicola]
MWRDCIIRGWNRVAHIKASPKTLTAIATALQCNDVETQHLFSLAGHSLPSVRVAAACCKIAAHNQQMLDDPVTGDYSKHRVSIFLAITPPGVH